MSEHDQNNYNWAIFIVIIIVGAMWFHISDLNKKINAYQNQAGEYDSCVSDLQQHESDLTNTVIDAQNYLEDGGSDNYVIAEDTLSGADTGQVQCDISSIDDLIQGQ